MSIKQRLQQIANDKIVYYNGSLSVMFWCYVALSFWMIIPVLIIGSGFEKGFVFWLFLIIAAVIPWIKLIINVIKEKPAAVFSVTPHIRTLKLTEQIANETQKLEKLRERIKYSSNYHNPYRPTDMWFIDEQMKKLHDEISLDTATKRELNRLWKKYK